MVEKARICRIARPAHAGGVNLRSVGRAVGAIPRPLSHSRSDPSTLAARQPDPFAGLRKRRQPWPTQSKKVAPVSRPISHVAAVTWGARASYRGGEHGTTGSAQALVQDRSRALHSAVLGPCCSEKQFPGLLPSPRRRVIRRIVLASQEATPPQGVRGEGRQKAWLLGVISRIGSKARACRLRRWLTT